MPKNSKEYNKKNYKKYWWTEEQKKYRADLNRRNHKNWNYGNGDNKDLHHVGNNPKATKTKTISASSNRSMWAKKANKRRWG